MDKTLAKDTIKWLKDTINMLGVSQRELALASGMRLATVNALLNGK